MWEVASKQINKNKLPLKKKPQEGLSKERGIYLEELVTEALYEERLHELQGRKGYFFSLSIQLELQLRPCKPHFKRQIRNRKGYVLFSKSYMT